jgi:hypothetical protein
VSERSEGLARQGGEQVLCRVCLKPTGPDERRWLAHYWGVKYTCVQDPRQFVEEK